MKEIFKNHFYLVLISLTTILVVIWFILINNGEYGTTLFFTIPASIGFLIGYSQKYNDKSNSKIKKTIKALLIIMLVVAGLAALLIGLGLEGAICILMAYPFIIIPMFLAYLTGIYIGKIDKKNSVNINSILFILILNPTTFIYDSNQTPIKDEITTELTINTSIDNIWNELTSEIKFNNKPNIIFEKGVSYPKSIKLLNDSGKYSYECYTNNDTISLNIIQFEAKNKVRFVLKEQTIPMKEMTPYNSINAKHLHNYFVVNYGEIKLESLSPNATKIIAKTSYNYNISPKWYWKLWSNHIIAEMQLHVLQSIKSKYGE